MIAPTEWQPDRQQEPVGNRDRGQRVEERVEKSPKNQKRQNQNSNANDIIFGKEDNKVPQDLKEVKNYETELMNYQMRRDNVILQHVE